MLPPRTSHVVPEPPLSLVVGLGKRPLQGRNSVSFHRAHHAGLPMSFQTPLLAPRSGIWVNDPCKAVAPLLSSSAPRSAPHIVPGPTPRTEMAGLGKCAQHRAPHVVPDPLPVVRPGVRASTKQSPPVVPKPLISQTPPVLSPAKPGLPLLHVRFARSPTEPRLTPFRSYSWLLALFRRSGPPPPEP